MLGRFFVAVVAIGGVVGGCVHGGAERESEARPDEPAHEAPRSGDVEIARGEQRLSSPYVASNQLFGLPQRNRPVRLRGVASTQLSATFSPAAVPNPANGAIVAYGSFQRGLPVIRVYDAAGGRDVLVDRGAFSVAWRSDSAFAYFKGLEPRIRDPNRYLGHVVVRRSLNAKPIRWTTRPGRYVVAAWARETLLVYRFGRTSAELLALDGPARLRVIASPGALVAVAPDGSKAFVSNVGATAASTPPHVSIVDIAGGAETAKLRLGGEADRFASGLQWVAFSGSWTRDLVVAPSNVGIVVFRVRDDAIELEQVLHFDPEAFPLGVSEPQTDDSARRVIVGAELAPRPRQAVPNAALYECDRITRRCVEGPLRAATEPPRLVYNPSRPL